MPGRRAAQSPGAPARAPRSRTLDGSFADDSPPQVDRVRSPEMQAMYRATDEPRRAFTCWTHGARSTDCALQRASATSGCSSPGGGGAGGEDAGPQCAPLDVPAMPQLRPTVIHTGYNGRDTFIGPINANFTPDSWSSSDSSIATVESIDCDPITT